jgi:hypothetical protein
MSTSRARSIGALLALAALVLLLLLLAYFGPPDILSGPNVTLAPSSDFTTMDSIAEETPTPTQPALNIPDGNNPYDAVSAPPSDASPEFRPPTYDPNWSPFPFNPTASAPSIKRTTAQLEAAILKWADMKNHKVAHEGSREIRTAGEHAFPVLLAHLNDKTPASKSFQKAVAVARGVVYPTIGDVCWDELHWQIMGAYQKGDPDYEPFTPATIGAWLAAHAGQDLWQLRIAATEEVLAAEKAKDPPNANLLSLLESRLKHIKALTAKAKSPHPN